MTVKSWNKTQFTGTASPGFQRPVIHDDYAQNGTNATRAERLAGVYKVHPYNMARNRYQKPAMKVSLVGGTIVYNTSTDSCGAQPVYPDIPMPDNSKAIAKLLQKWRDSDINVGVTIGEGREAVSMMVDRMTSIAKSANALRKGNLGGALAALAKVSKSDKRRAWKQITTRNFASAWLELRYGWIPLLNDIYGAADFVKPKPLRIVIRSSEKVKGTITGTQNFPPGDVISVKCERSLHLMVKVTNSADNFERMGLRDPYTLAWELTRFSFVADWFLPIGDTLAANHAKRAMKVSEASTSQVLKLVSQFRVRSGTKYGNFVAKSDGLAEFNSVSMQRTVSFGVPGSWGIVDQIPALLTPTWDPPVARLISAAALARVALTKLR